jgi:Mn2+/Fe2+ NRAMP family transporter
MTGVDVAKSAAKTPSPTGWRESRLWRVLGPGLITGASDDDPSGIATYSQAGARFGFTITWTMLFTYPLMCVIQEISGRIGRTTGIGIAGNLRKHYPNWLLLPVVGALFLANTINIGADLGAMADVLMLLVGGPHLVYVLGFGAFCAVLQILARARAGFDHRSVRRRSERDRHLFPGRRQVWLHDNVAAPDTSNGPPAQGKTLI